MFEKIHKRLRVLPEPEAIKDLKRYKLQFFNFQSPKQNYSENNPNLLEYDDI